MNSVQSTYLRNMTDDQLRLRCDGPEGQRLIDRAFPGQRVAVEAAADLRAALQSVDADFQVEKRPLLAVNHVEGLDAPDASIQAVESHVTTMRTDTDSIVGIVGADYGVVQTFEALRPLDIRAKRGDVKIVNVELLGGGSRVRVTALLGISSFLSLGGAPNTLCHFAVFEVSHDGNSSASAAVYTLRVECFNGMTSRSVVTKHTLRHTSKAASRVEEYTEKILRELIGDVQAEAAIFADLVQRPMGRVGFEAFAVDLLGGELAEDVTDSKRTRRQNAIDELVGYFVGGNQGAGATAWGAYNSVTRWIEGKREGIEDAAKAARKFDSNLAGSGQATVAKALRKLTR